MITGSATPAGRRGVKPNGAGQHSVSGTNGLQIDVGPSTGVARCRHASEPTTAFRIVLHGCVLGPDNSPSPASDLDAIERRISASELVHHIAENGFQAVKRFRGSFVVIAIASHSSHAEDSSNHRIDCYRSRTGGRTVFWTCGSEGFSLADSAYQVASTQPGTLREDSAWLAEFFALSSRWTAGLSPFEGIRELLPGEHLTISDGNASTSRSPLALSLENRPRKISEWVEAFGHRLDRSVADSLPANGPTAIMLSGGMDSGPVAAIASEIAKGRNQPLHALSWRIRGLPACDEWEWISMLARHLGIPVAKIDAEDHLAFSGLDASQIEPDSPLYNPFRPLILACYERARQLGCEVILNASSGDEIYPHPNRALIDDICRAELRSAVRRLAAIYRYYGPRRLHRATELRGLARALMPRLGHAKRQAPAWLTAEAARHLQPIDPWPPELKRSLHPDFGRQLFGAMASGGIAREVRFSLRYGVDRRDPYLDPDLRRLMLNLPHTLIYRQGTTKWIAREAMRGRMPEAFRTKPRTGLLNAFFNHGFDRNREEIRAFLMDQRMLWAPWIKPDYLKATLEGKSSEERPRLVAGACIGYVLWKKRIGEE